MGSHMSSKSSSRAFSSLLVAGVPLTQAHRARLEPFFSTIWHMPNRKEIQESDVKNVDVIYGSLPKVIQSVKDAPGLRFVQLASAGSDEALESAIWKEEGSEKIRMTTAAGVHTGPIPQYFIATTLALYHRLQEQIIITQTEKRWPSDTEAGGGRMFIRELRGKTVGILGYGHIGRESARLAAAFGAKIIAANSDGKKKVQDGYIIPGTGDPDGSIPSEWFSTKDTSSLASFLSKTDVLLLSLPSTPATQHIISSLTLSHLPTTSVLVNVGRGDLVETSALVDALDNGKLAGAALDVTDPEPLPIGHTLYGRKNVVLTPHLSGRTEIYFDLAVEIFLANLERWKDGKELLNVVDPKRGY